MILPSTARRGAAATPWIKPSLKHSSATPPQPIPSGKSRIMKRNSIRSMEGKTVAVTGATGGIGRATAHGLALMGAHVIIVERDPHALKKPPKRSVKQPTEK